MPEQKVKLIYCGVGNEKLDSLAVNVGIHYGMQFPASKKPPFPIYFSDQNWKKPDKDKYIDWVAEYQPKIATVLDVEASNQLDEAISWGELISPYVEEIVLIPKVNGIIEEIPRRINEKKVVLGYSIPTTHGGTTVPINEFSGWDIHILGGNPQKQLEMYDKMAEIEGSVTSIDCNYISMKATKFCAVWTRKLIRNRQWMDLQDIIGYKVKDSMYTAFALSCVSLVSAWHEKLGGLYHDI